MDFLLGLITGLLLRYCGSFLAAYIVWLVKYSAWHVKRLWDAGHGQTQ